MANPSELLFKQLSQSWEKGFHFDGDVGPEIFLCIRYRDTSLKNGNHRQALLFATQALALGHTDQKGLKKILRGFKNDPVEPESVLLKLEELARQDTTGSFLRSLYEVHCDFAKRGIVSMRSLPPEPSLQKRRSVVFPGATPK